MPDIPHIQVNGEPFAWQPLLHVAAVIESLQADPNSVATALNGEFVPRDRREATLLHAGDTLTVFKAIVGG